MHLDSWEEVGRAQRERVLGRTLHEGAPLTSRSEHDVADLDARNSDGTFTIPHPRPRTARSRLRSARAIPPPGYNDDADSSASCSPPTKQT